MGAGATALIPSLQIVFARRGVARLGWHRAGRHGRFAFRRNSTSPRAIVAQRPVVVISKRSPRRRNAIAPERRQTWRSTTSAVQPGGASRALTTSTARRQSSSKASIVFAMATSEPSRSLPTQPAASHLIPSPSVLSLGVRASASAASHSRNAKRSLPDLTTENRPLSPRTAAALPSPAISTSGWGARIISTMAPPISKAPMNRSGVLRRQSTTSPAVHRSSGPIPNAAIRPTAPGKLVTPKRNGDHPLDALPHQPPAQAVEAERHAHQAENSRRHD